MAKQLQYELKENVTDPKYREEVFGVAEEAHELAADIQHLGAAVLFNETQTGNILLNPAEVTVPNSLSAYTEKRTIRSLYGIGKDKRKRDASIIAGADQSLGELQTALKYYGRSGETEVRLQAVVPESQGIKVLRDLEANENREAIFDAADMPQFLRESKAMTAKSKGRNPDKFNWSDYFNSASDEQLTNFSQWYTERLKILANPETKAELIDSLKSDYKSRIERAMQEGWISGALKSTLDRRIIHTDVRFFSPFGRIPDHWNGFAQPLSKDKSLVVLPTVPGEHATIHELGHVFGRIDVKGTKEYFNKRPSEQLIPQRTEKRLGHFYTILDEGFNDHTTTALINGAPEVIRPSERKLRGIPETAWEGSSKYKSYREVCGALMGGPEGVISLSDIRELTDIRVKGSFADLADFINNKKWHGRDVLSEMLNVIVQHDNDNLRAENYNNPDYNEKLLETKIIERLRAA